MLVCRDHKGIPQVYGPRWTTIDEVPERLRANVVEAGVLPVDGVVDLLPKDAEITVSTGCWDDHDNVTATPQNLWAAVADAVALGGPYIPYIRICKVTTKEWEWDFANSFCKIDNDPHHAEWCDFKAAQVAFDGGGDLDLAIRVLSMFRDIKEQLMRVQGAAQPITP